MRDEISGARGSRRSRIYGQEARPGDTQGDYMRAEPYVAAPPQREDPAGLAQRGQHGEGAATIGNSVRGMVSGGLSGATTTRGGQQGGIGASVHDPDPALVSGRGVDDPSYEPEQDRTLGEQHGGTMEPPQR
jgi:hypothetical protein